MLDASKRLLGPLIPLVTLPILYLNLDSFVVSCFGVAYMFPVLVTETPPKGPWRTILRIMVPQLVMFSAVYGNMISLVTMAYCEVFWIGLIIVYSVTRAGRRGT